MSFSAGTRTQARCTRCKDVTSHIVIVVVDGLPAKVECCACKSIHKYYPIEKPKVKKENTPIRVSANQSRDARIESATKNSAPPKTRTSTSSTARTSKKEVSEQQWHSAIMDSHITPKNYNVNLEVSIDDLVEHPTFGTGIVQDIVGNDKAEILFKEGSKILKCQPN